MTLWLILALMTTAALGAVLWPLLRSRGAVRSGSDVAVYREQLEGIARDQTLGLIPPSEAEAARVEISRRLIAAADRAKQSDTPAAASLMRLHRAVSIAVLLLLPLVAGGFYLWLGSPNIAAAPIAARQNAVAEQRSIEAMVTQVETYLQRNPNDGRGWEVLAPVYMRLGRYDESATAWRSAMQILGENAERQANLGESLMAAADGVITTEAKAAFDRAVTLDPTLVSARYYQGLAAEQDGQRDEAARLWRNLIAEAPAGAHWVDQVREALARVEGKPGAAPAPAARAPAPSTATPAPVTPNAATAENAPAPQGGDPIRGMVDRLAARLKQNGSDADGWVMLVRSYKVMGDTDSMRGAVADARRALGGDAEKLQRFEAGLKEVESAAPPPDTAAPEAPPPAASPGPAPAARGPSAGDMAAADAMAPDQRNSMINNMVAGLAERLKKDGSDLDGWQRLLRSYVVLGDKDKARAALADARRALSADADKLRQLDEFAKGLDIEG